MRIIHCVNKEGEHFTIRQNDHGRYCCPVCGSPEFEEAPYDENGSASFQMCSCGFEFGFDDSPLASEAAVEGVVANWDRWRLKIIEKHAHSKTGLEQLEKKLNNLNIDLAFDLRPVKRNKST